MIKKTLYITFAVVTFSVFTTSALHAQSSSSTEATSSVSQAPRTEKIQARMSLSKARQVRVANLNANISNRLDATIVRLTTISTRLQSRIDILKIEGLAVTAAEAKLHQAQQELQDAKTKMSNIDVQVAQVVGSETPKDAWQQVKSTFLETHHHLVHVRQLLTEVVTELRQSTNKVNDLENATSTNTASTTSN